jgi:hypothetical protein
MRRARLDHIVHVTVTDRATDAAELIRKLPGVSKITLTEEDARGSISTTERTRTVINVTLEDNASHLIADLPNRLVNAGFRITSFTEENVNLETAFMRLTQGLVQ